jgi:hypothetical protein
VSRRLDDLRRFAADPRLIPVAAVVGAASVVAFWVLTVIAASRQPGYDPTRDYVSSLAATGAQQPWLGIAAIVLLGCSYLAAGHVLLWHLSAALAAGLVAAAGLVTLLVAIARIDCPGGSANCGLISDVGVYLERVDEASWGQVVHGPAVVVSSALLVAGMIAVVVRSDRWDATRIVSAAAAALSSLTPLLWVPSDQPGLGQRVWLAALSGWILWVSLTPLWPGRSRDVDARAPLG